LDSKKLNNPVNIDEVDYLPSVNLIYKLRDEELSPQLLRFNFSQSVGRPSLREAGDMATYDFEFQTLTTGNPLLKIAHINNYDLRFEWYLRSGDYLAASAFYKSIQNDIELTNFGGALGYTWLNNPNMAYVQGIELDGRKKLTKHFDFSANVTFAYSRTRFEKLFPYASGGFISGGYVDHPMFGQAPYVVNAMITYSLEKYGLLTSLIYNVQGPRIVIEGGAAYPDTYEMPRNLIDLMVLKSISKHFSVRLKVKNILNAPVLRSYKFDPGYILFYDKYTYGTDYILGLIYKI